MDRKIEKESWQFSISEEDRKKGLQQISQAVERKQIKRIPSFAEKVWSQLRFQTWKYWTLQGGVLLAAMLLIFWMERNKSGGIESVVFCGGFLVLAGNIALSGLGRLFSWHMAELEQTLYLNLKQMVCIQMLAAGVIDLAVLSLFVLMNGHQSGMGVGQYLLYLLVPFLWSDILYLNLLTAMRKSSLGYRQLVSAVLCAVFVLLLPSLWEHVYTARYIPLWVLLCAAGVCLLILQIKRILDKIERGEEICLN